MRTFRARATVALVGACLAFGAATAAPKADEAAPANNTFSVFDRVVKLPDGTFDLYASSGRRWGFGDPDGLLAPCEGRFVRVDYTLQPEAPKFGVINNVGGGWPTVDKVTVVARRPEDLPVTVDLVLTRTEYDFGEPIQATVTIKNNSKEIQTLDFARAGALALGPDYRALARLEDGLGRDKRPYGLFEPRQPLAPGQSITFKLTSTWMAEPGRYTLVYAAPYGKADDPSSLSEFRPVRVLVPASEEARQGALGFWVTHAAPEQRVHVAQKLLQCYDDVAGVVEVLRMLKAGELPATDGEWTRAYGFAWRYGGKEGHDLLLAGVHRLATQLAAEGIIDHAMAAEKPAETYARLLGDTTEVRGQRPGWGETPRICDLTAGFLADRVEPAMKFPQEGPVAERDAAVAALRNQLAADLKAFPCFQPTPEDRLAEALEKEGCAVTRDGLFPGHPIVSVRIGMGEGRGDFVKMLAGVKGLRRLTGTCERLADVELKNLGDLKTLEELDLAGANTVSDETLKEIGRLTNLRRLVLWHHSNTFTDAGLAHLRGLKNLQFLDLNASPVTDAGLAHLAGLPDLEVLNLSRTHITDTGLASLKALKNLRKLVIDDTPQVTAEAVKALAAAIPGLKIERAAP
jgi:hypothetical protein